MAILFINFLYNKIMNFEKLLQMNSKSLIQDPIFPDSINSIAADFENFTSQATTILSLKFNNGVIMVGDRRATQGNYIADDNIVKVFDVDESSMIGVAGTTAIAFELIKRFKVEVLHYEKVKNKKLSFEGKVSHLSSLIKSNINLINAGLIAVPIFAGKSNKEFKISSFDALGGAYYEDNYSSIGSGSRLANVYLQDNFNIFNLKDAITCGIKALQIAASNDSATVGPSIENNIFPTIYVCTSEDLMELSNEEIKSYMKDLK